MGAQQVVMAAVVVDESVLQGEGVEPAGRPRVPRNLLGARGKASLRRVLLDDHHVLVTRKRLRDAIDVERLHGVAGDYRNRLARGFEAFSELHCFLHDDSVGQNAYVAAALDVAQLAEYPGVRSEERRVGKE